MFSWLAFKKKIETLRLMVVETSRENIFLHDVIIFPIEPIYRKRHRVKINDNSRLTKLRAIESAFVTSHVNIYVRGKGVHSRTFPQCKFSFLYRVRIEIILLNCKLSLINACCCRADATINSLRLRRRELIHHNLPSNIMH